MYRYMGPGFYPGVPARDISDDEAEELGIVDLLEASKDYRYVGGKPKAQRGHTSDSDSDQAEPVSEPEPETDDQAEPEDDGAGDDAGEQPTEEGA